MSLEHDVRSPDIQIHCLPAYVVDHGRMRIKGHGVTINTCNLRPKSIGSVTLRSADPTRGPGHRPGVPPGPVRLEDLDGGIRAGTGDPERPAVQGPDPEGAPARRRRQDARPAIREYIKQWSKTDYHPVGSCKMGSDPMAVVDTQLRVHGLGGLRVIDASIMPTLISGNTQAPSIMVGEKGAAIMRAGKVV